ncbi:MAG: small nuclear ribonucleoprotein [Methanomicrobia archaeon]|nr:small nuclear ribonucleoprotein [Methanomicrobia archaeon]MCK4637491.1 small nuclear ribonucleoprotein [Methanomicrobia archaeon]
MAEKPLDIIHKSIDGVVLIELKGGREFRGTLKGYDIHMNLVLKDAEELVNGEIVRNFGYVVIRGDSVVLISPSIR